MQDKCGDLRPRSEVIQNWISNQVLWFFAWNSLWYWFLIYIHLLFQAGERDSEICPGIYINVYFHKFYSSFSQRYNNIKRKTFCYILTLYNVNISARKDFSTHAHYLAFVASTTHFASPLWLWRMAKTFTWITGWSLIEKYILILQPSVNTNFKSFGMITIAYYLLSLKQHPILTSHSVK